jgi:mRNA interferase MazF
MARFVKGDVVVLPFPFSDLSQSKRRPALVITELLRNDIILCQITSQKISDNYAILLEDNDFEERHLKVRSNVRPNRIFTADTNIVLYKVGSLKREKTKEIIEKIIKILQS